MEHVEPFQISPFRSKMLACLVVVAPIVCFFLVLNRKVPLVPLVDMNMKCAECDRQATRTIRSAADALRVKGVYVYDKKKYPKGAPVWCDYHGPDKDVENAGTAYLAAIGAFVAAAVVYKKTAS